MATLTGQRGTLNISQDQREIDMGDTISLLEPDSSKLTLISKGRNGASKKKAISPKFSWLEDSSEPRFDAVNGTTGTGTSVVVDNGAYFAEHFLVLVTRTSEVMRVIGVAGNTLTVARGVGGSAVALADNDELMVIGVAQPEGDTSRPARSSNPSVVTNYTQIFREPFDMTNTLRSSDMVTTEHDWNHQAKKHGIEHAKDIEYSLMLGRASEDTSGSQPRRTTKGVIRHITTNVLDAGGALTETEFQTFLRMLFRYSSGGRKVAFGSPLVVSVLNAFAAGKLQTRQGESTYGLAVQDYVSPFGTLHVMTHWLLEGAVYGGYLVGLDMSEIKYRFLGGGIDGSRDTHIARNIQETDRDGKKDEYRTEAGLELGQEKKHGLLTGVTS